MRTYKKSIQKKRIKKKHSKKSKTVINRDILIFSDLRLFLVIFFVALLSLLGIMFCFFSIKQVNGYGMLPTLRDRDILIIQKRAKLERFDLVFLNNGLEGEFRRIIGLPGEKIELKNDVLFVDNVSIDEKYLVNKINYYQQQGKQLTTDFYLSNANGKNIVPTGYYLVLGDNRPYTTDSRDYGLVSLDVIVGKAVLRLIPLERAEYY